MNSNHVSGVGHRSYPRTSPGVRAFLFSAMGVLLLSSACAKRPEVVATAPPPTAGGGPIAQEPGGQRPTQPALRPPMAESGVTTEPSGPPSSGPAAGPTVQKPGEEEGTLKAGAAPSIPLPPGSEAVAPPPSPPREQPVTQVAQLAPKESPLKDIFFDFDKAQIRPDAKGPLEEDIAWLKAHPKAAFTIEGHCDERGTSEYNLGLGERRAKATKDYLAASAIDGKRITTVSYGKERPFVLGHDETAWKWNRRAHFVVTKE